MSSGVIRVGATPSYEMHEIGEQTGEEELVRYIHSNNVFLPSLHSPRNFFVREVQTRLIVGRVRPCPRQFLASRRELIG